MNLYDERGVESHMHQLSSLLAGVLIFIAVSGFAEAAEPEPAQETPWADPEVVWLGERPDGEVNLDHLLPRKNADQEHWRDRAEITKIMIDPTGRYVAASLYRHAINRPGTDWDAWVMVWDLQTSRRWVIRDAYRLFDVSKTGAVLVSGFDDPDRKRKRFHRPLIERLMLWHTATHQADALAWDQPQQAGKAEPAEAGFDNPKQTELSFPHAARISELNYVVAVHFGGQVVLYNTDRRTGERTEDPPVVVDRIPSTQRGVTLLMPGQGVMLMQDLKKDSRVIVYRNPSGPKQLARRLVYGMNVQEVPDELEAVGLFEVLNLVEHGRGEQVAVPAFWVHGISSEHGLGRMLIPMASSLGRCMVYGGEGAGLTIRHHKAQKPWKWENKQEHARHPPAFALSQDGDWFLHAHGAESLRILDARTGQPIRELPCTR